MSDEKIVTDGELGRFIGVHKRDCIAGGETCVSSSHWLATALQRDRAVLDELLEVLDAYRDFRLTSSAFNNARALRERERNG